MIDSPIHPSTPSLPSTPARHSFPQPKNYIIGKKILENAKNPSKKTVALGEIYWPSD